MTRYLMHPMTTDPLGFGFNTEDATPPSHGARTEPSSTLLPQAPEQGMQGIETPTTTDNLQGEPAV